MIELAVMFSLFFCFILYVSKKDPCYFKGHDWVYKLCEPPKHIVFIGSSCRWERKCAKCSRVEIHKEGGNQGYIESWYTKDYQYDTEEKIIERYNLEEEVRKNW